MGPRWVELAVAFLGGMLYAGGCWWLAERWQKAEREQLAADNELLRAELERLRLGGYLLPPELRSPRKSDPTTRT